GEVIGAGRVPAVRGQSLSGPDREAFPVSGQLPVQERLREVILGLGGVPPQRVTVEKAGLVAAREVQEFSTGGVDVQALEHHETPRPRLYVQVWRRRVLSGRAPGIQVRRGRVYCALQPRGEAEAR